MALFSPLHDCHLAANATLCNFANWHMPLHYGSQLEEHHHVRTHAGLFDVSHMTIIDITGAQAYAFLRYLLANDLAKLKQPGSALYSCLLNEQGGIIDDLIVYWLTEQHYRLISNAATREKVIRWITKQADNFEVTCQAVTTLAILALQGPKANDYLQRVLGKPLTLPKFHCLAHNGWLIARTGYTGEDGFEICLPHAEAIQLWEQLRSLGVPPCGLGARDTLRLEAGLNLYGTDMDETTSPLKSNLGWTVAFEPAERDFIGRSALLAEKAQGISETLTGFILCTKGVLRNGQPILADGEPIGFITSGGFSPTLQKGIALARITAKIGADYTVVQRNKTLPLQRVKLPFVRNGSPAFEEFTL